MRALIGIELLRKLPAGPCDIRDTKLPGFLLRVRPSGVHTYYANYGRGKWQKLGTTAVLTAPKAREQARKVLGDVMTGADPIAEKRAERSRITFDTFIREHMNRGRWLSGSLARNSRRSCGRSASMRCDSMSCRHFTLNAGARRDSRP